MRGKAGVAALFDAMFFLAVVSVVSVALLASMTGQDDRDQSGQHNVEGAHQVLLRSTLQDISNNTFQVEQLFEMGRYQEELHERNISTILDLLLPGMVWRWTVTIDGDTLSFGSQVGEQENVYCSMVHAPAGEEEVTFKLEAWVD